MPEPWHEEIFVQLGKPAVWMFYHTSDDTIAFEAKDTDFHSKFQVSAPMPVTFEDGLTSHSQFDILALGNVGDEAKA